VDRLEFTEVDDMKKASRGGFGSTDKKIQVKVVEKGIKA